MVVVLDQLILVLFGAIKLNRFEMSEFAFRQLAHHTDTLSKRKRQLRTILPELRLFQTVLTVLAAVLSIVLLSHLLRPILGTLFGLGLFLLISIITRASFIQDLALHLFETSAGGIITATRKLHVIWVIIGIFEPTESTQPDSLEEFTDQLRRLPSTVINPIQRQRLESILASEDKTVKDIMTSKKRVVMVESSATLGPIVLSDLQKSGHGYFPVATKKGELEGILQLADLGDIQSAKTRTTVADLMIHQLTWVKEEESLYELVQTFLREKQYLILVKDDHGEFSGVVTVADVMKHLLGITKD